MKKIVLIFSTVFFASFLAQSQTTQFGIKAGLNIASLDVKEADNYDSKAAGHVGVLAHIHISDHFAVQPELVYSMQGGKAENHKLQMNYVNIPVLAQYMSQGFRIQTGPQLGILTSAERKEGELDIDVNDRLNTLDFSWSFGVGYLSPTGLGIDARYNHGISNVNEESENSVARNRVLQVGLFYQFMNKTRTVKK